MNVIHPCCAGLDLHKKTIVANIRRIGADGQPSLQTRTFGTRTAAVLEMADWLAAEGATHVAMGATGVSWKPVDYLLEDRFELLPVNAQHIKDVPGRKADVKDAEWIAQLLPYGLLQGGLRAPRADSRAARPDPATHPTDP